MLISRVDVFGYVLTYVHGEYVMSRGRVIGRLDSTVVRLTTDEGLVGWGGVCPLGPAYLPAHAQGARAALRELAPTLVGLDPRNLAAVNDAMDAALLGHAYAKSPIDVACWDLSARSPVSRSSHSSAVLGRIAFRSTWPFPLAGAEQMRPSSPSAAARSPPLPAEDRRRSARGRERVRVVAAGLEDEDRLIADANGGWRLRDALLAARLIEDVERIYLEQPCPTVGECRSLRAMSSLPLVLDEVVSDVPSLLEAAAIGGVAAVNLKISKVGGLTKARIIRDLAEGLGLAITVEDTWGATSSRRASPTWPQASGQTRSSPFPS